jgi:hypothetical protein
LMTQNGVLHEMPKKDIFFLEIELRE